MPLKSSFHHLFAPILHNNLLKQLKTGPKNEKNTAPTTKICFRLSFLQGGSTRASEASECAPDLRVGVRGRGEAPPPPQIAKQSAGPEGPAYCRRQYGAPKGPPKKKKREARKARDARAKRAHRALCARMSARSARMSPEGPRMSARRARMSAASARMSGRRPRMSARSARTKFVRARTNVGSRRTSARSARVRLRTNVSSARTNEVRSRVSEFALERAREARE